MARNDRDHGGGLDGAMQRFGGSRETWVDLSTGINPIAYEIGGFTGYDWTTLPDRQAENALIAAARRFWQVPEGADVLAVPGCSVAIAQIPTLAAAGTVDIATPTYNEHAAAFAYHGWSVTDDANAQARVIVNPNNPTGHFPAPPVPTDLTIIDESFCDIAPANSMINLANTPRHLILKGLGKFWGLAGLRLGFVIGDPALVNGLRNRLGPWPVSGPALRIGAGALNDTRWAKATRDRLAADAIRLDRIMLSTIGANPMGETTLFRTYEVDDATALHNRLASAHIWTRVFPYSDTWIRFGLPAPHQWEQLEQAL
ncbi:MAG: threonine-phosphate decarboxylase [Planktomarina sp.]